MDTTTATPSYTVERLQSGSERWAFARNGVALTVHRYRKSAEKEVDMARFFVEHMGHESATVEGYLRRLAEQEEAEATAIVTAVESVDWEDVAAKAMAKIAPTPAPLRESEVVAPIVATAHTADEIRDEIAARPNTVQGAFDAPIKPGTLVRIRKVQGNQHLVGAEGVVVAARRINMHPDAAATIRAMGREPITEHYLVVPVGRAHTLAVTCPLDGLEAIA